MNSYSIAFGLACLTAMSIYPLPHTKEEMRIARSSECRPTNSASSDKNFWPVAAPIPRATKNRSLTYLPLSVRSKWIYTHSNNNEFKRIDMASKVETKGDIFTLDLSMQTKDGRMIPSGTLRSTGNGLYELSGDDDEISNCLLKLPVRVGDKWDCLSSEGAKAQAVCAGIEEVEVPAGRFKAAKVTISWKPSEFDVEIKETAWYALNIGLIKFSSCPDSDLVLESFVAGD